VIPRKFIQHREAVPAELIADVLARVATLIE
jgi:hypothetical protein